MEVELSFEELLKTVKDFGAEVIELATVLEGFETMSEFFFPCNSFSAGGVGTV